VPRPRGGDAWGHSTVRRMFEHAGERKRFGRRTQAMQGAAFLAM
jgi:hypothetical protein